MLNASIVSFNSGDNSLLRDIFSKAVVELEAYNLSDDSSLRILTSDDLFIKTENKYYYYEYHESDQVSKYDEIYEERIRKLKDEEGN